MCCIMCCIRSGDVMKSTCLLHVSLVTLRGNKPRPKFAQRKLIMALGRMGKILLNPSRGAGSDELATKTLARTGIDNDRYVVFVDHDVHGREVVVGEPERVKVADG